MNDCIHLSYAIKSMLDANKCILLSSVVNFLRMFPTIILWNNRYHKDFESSLSVLSLQYRWTSIKPSIQSHCMMQVNASQYFTGFHWNYHACLTGSTYSKNPGLSLPVWMADSPFHLMQVGDGNVFLFQADKEYHTGHSSLLIQQPLIIMGMKKLDLHIVGPINKW